MEPVAVLITWMDAFEGPSGWVVHSEYDPKAVKPMTLGWLLRKEKKLEGYTTVYSTHYLDDSGELIVADPNHIPDDMVLDIKYIDM